MENCLKTAVLLGLMVQLCYPLQLKYNNCGSDATIESFDITPCQSDPCILHKGRNYKLNVTFTPAESSKKVYTVAKAIVGVMSMSIPVASDSCNSGDLTCPIEKGTTMSYTNTLVIATTYPSIRYKSKWEIYDDKWKKMLCFEVALEIQN